DLSDALEKVNVLSGMLPICASCKKIRDDKGYWRQIEGYIAEHSEAEFSHSICPECAKRLYPEFADEMQKKGIL
ncbi:MAG: response regulator, partial [Desulfobulbaceae bacterium]|nr:response regulator [Desulfobulbaceae bacterium]